MINDQATLRRASLELIRSVYPPRLGIRLVGVTLSNFDQEIALKDEQLGLGLDVRPAAPPLPPAQTSQDWTPQAAAVVASA